jgi:PAS domain S-box-containing protein
MPWPITELPYPCNVHVDSDKDTLSMRTAESQSEHLAPDTRYLALAVEHSPDSIIITDPQWVIEYVNRAFTQVTGYSREDALGQNISILRSQQDIDAVEEMLDALHRGDRWDGNIITRRKDGDEFWDRVSITPVTAPDGTVTNFLCVSCDISELKQRETELLLSEERFRNAFEFASSGMGMVDLDGRMIDANPAMCEMLGYSREEIKGKTVNDFIHPDDRDVSANERARIKDSTDAPPPIERRFVHKDGSEIWVLLNRNVVRDADGNPSHFIAQAQDITARKRVEDALRDSELRYRMIVEALDCISDGIEIIDTDGRFLYCNERQKEFYPDMAEYYVPGTKVEDMVRAVATSGQVRNLDSDVEDWIASRLEDLQQGNSEPHIFQHPSGRWLLVRDHKTLGGATVCVRTDITHQKKIDAELRASQKRLSAITANLFESVLVSDTYGHITFANPAANALLSVEPGRPIAGLDIDDVLDLVVDGQVVRFADGPFQRVVAQSVPYRNDDAVVEIKDGKRLEVAIACSPLREEKKVRGCVLSFRDIKDLKAAQRDALQSLKLASVGELAAGIAHEINTPSQYIGDNLRFLGESFGELKSVLDAYRRVVDAVRETGGFDDLVATADAAAQGADLEYLLDEIPSATEQSINGIQQISRIVLAMKEFSHPGQKEKVATDINKALENTLTVCRNEWKHVAEVETDFDLSLPLVPCLTGEMNQVFLNMIVNATHAIADVHSDGDGAIKISTAQQGDDAEIRISDNGTGIPAKIRDKIFDPFFTTKEVGKGTGQGLSVCHDVVANKHGGSIRVESTEGEGSTFIIRLPLTEAKETPEAA